MDNLTLITALFVIAAIMLAGLPLLSACTAGGNGPAPDTPTGAENTPAPTPINGAKASDGKVAFYQLAPDPNSLMMSYVIKTANGKVIVVDGGIDGQGLDNDPYLPAAIRAVLGLNENDYFEVEAWFLTHHHKDHFYELAKMLVNYKESDNYRINNFYFCFPDIGVEWTSSAGDKDHDLAYAKILKEGFDHYYSLVPFQGIKGADIPVSEWQKPEGAENYYYGLINGAVINDANVDSDEGLSIDVDGVRFDVLLKWAKGNQNVNSTSTIIRMVYKEHSCLFLGDSYTDNSQRVYKKVGADALKSEYVQMGHHGQNGPAKAFYNKIDIKNSIRLWPTPVWVWNVDESGPYHTYETRTWAGLPADYKEFEAQNLLQTGRDYVAGLYTAYPEDPSSAASWTEEVLNAQRVGLFD